MPVADSFRYMAEPIQYCKVKKKEKATIKKKNREEVNIIETINNRKDQLRAFYKIKYLINIQQCSSRKITDITEIQKNGKRILQFYASKCDNLEEMDTFLEAYNLLRLHQGEIDNYNRLITGSKIEFVI